MEQIKISNEHNKGSKKKWVDWKPIFQENLGDAINHAKGKQSMAEFARKCGLNPMTLSRAVNGKIEMPLDEKTIKAMAECSEFPTEEVMDSLMRANGCVKKGEKEKRRQKYALHSTPRKDRLDSAQSIIMRTLFEDGYTIIPVINTELEALDPTLKESRFQLRTMVMFALSVKGYDPAFRNYSVSIYTSEEFSSYKSPYKKNVEHEKQFMMERYKDVFLRDVWEPEAFENSKYSIVFLNKDLFESFFKELEGLKFNNTFSLILLDFGKQEVVEERFLPRHDGKKCESLFKKTNRGEL